MAQLHRNAGFDQYALIKTQPLFHTVCDIAGSRRLIEDARDGLKDRGVIAAVANHDSDVIFDWLTDALSYQGIGDSVAAQYMATHGSASAADIRRALSEKPSCPKLAGYWSFEGCRYHKGSRTCAEPEHVDGCPLPNHDLRNGRLNQTAYSLFLFFAISPAGISSAGLITGWLKCRLTHLTAPPHLDVPFLSQ